MIIQNLQEQIRFQEQKCELMKNKTDEKILNTLYFVQNYLSSNKEDTVIVEMSQEKYKVYEKIN